MDMLEAYRVDYITHNNTDNRNVAFCDTHEEAIELKAKLELLAHISNVVVTKENC